MNISAHTDTQTHACKKKKKKKEKARSNSCREENLSESINAIWIFSDTNPGIKKAATLSKESPLYKSKATPLSTVITSSGKILETRIEEK